MSTPPFIRPKLSDFKRIVVKIGSAIVVDESTRKVRANWIKTLAQDIADLRQSGCDVLIVSSGAIALGRSVWSGERLSLDQSQAAAAIGQIGLNQAYQDAFAAHGISIGQILLTPNITEERRYFINARDTMTRLLSVDVIPLINENDTVATSEIRYGDNDRLSARVASMVEADCLVLLSDIDGLYSAPPTKIDGAKQGDYIPYVEAITPAIEKMAGGAKSANSRGGMATKIDAAKLATSAGAMMIITDGRNDHPLKSIDEGARASFFAAASTPVAARKKWISGALDHAGEVKIDAGALRALHQGSSLLPIGVTDISGRFDRGDLVAIVDENRKIVARGLASFNAGQARAILGHRSREIEKILGIHTRTEMVHRDNMVMEKTPHHNEGQKDE